MKKSLLTAFTVFLSFVAGAQKIHFTDTSNVWKVLQPQYNASNPWIFNYYSGSFIGRQTIDSVEYLHFGFGVIREDTVANKVYIRSGDTEIVLMDYNLQAGDTFVTPHYKFPVLAVDSTLINSVWHKVWSFPFFSGGWYTGAMKIYVVEGIGCIEGPTFMMGNYSGCVECAQPLMYCFSNKGIAPPLNPKVDWLDNTSSCTKYESLSVQQPGVVNQITVYPNRALSSLSITAPYPIISLSICNMTGQTVYSHGFNLDTVQVDVSDLPLGVYLIRINGAEVRKFVKE